MRAMHLPSDPASPGPRRAGGAGFRLDRGSIVARSVVDRVRESFAAVESRGPGLDHGRARRGFRPVRRSHRAPRAPDRWQERAGEVAPSIAWLALHIGWHEDLASRRRAPASRRCSPGATTSSAWRPAPRRSRRDRGPDVTAARPRRAPRLRDAVHAATRMARPADLAPSPTSRRRRRIGDLAGVTATRAMAARHVGGPAGVLVRAVGGHRPRPGPRRRDGLGPGRLGLSPFDGLGTGSPCASPGTGADRFSHRTRRASATCLRPETTRAARRAQFLCPLRGRDASVKMVRSERACHAVVFLVLRP